MWIIGFLAVLIGLLLLYSAVSFALAESRHRPRGRFVRVAGVDIHYLSMSPDKPEGAPIVLVHGASGNLGDMAESLMPELAKRHYVVAFDRPGHGWSKRPLRDGMTDPAVQAGVLREAMHALGIKKPVLLGHSWGGAVATAYALSFPDELSGLLVMSGATHVWKGKTAWYHRLVRTPVLGTMFLYLLMVPGGQLLMGAGIRNNFAPNIVPADYARRIGLPLLFRPANFRANSQDSSSLRGHLRGQSQRYGDIKVPTIIVTGNRDQTVLAKLHSYALHAEIEGSEMIKLVGVGHMPHYVRPDLVTDALSRLSLGQKPDAGIKIIEPETEQASSLS
tara:strand:+ start:7185 stop:8186 length:1002 start_codon:yes stop_codon:yes gene_type:complete